MKMLKQRFSIWDNRSHERFNVAAGLTYEILSDLTGYFTYSQSNRAPTPVELTCADPKAPCRRRKEVGTNLW